MICSFRFTLHITDFQYRPLALSKISKKENTEALWIALQAVWKKHLHVRNLADAFIQSGLLWNIILSNQGLNYHHRSGCWVGNTWNTSVLLRWSTLRLWKISRGGGYLIFIFSLVLIIHVSNNSQKKVWWLVNWVCFQKCQFWESTHYVALEQGTEHLIASQGPWLGLSTMLGTYAFCCPLVCVSVYYTELLYMWKEMAVCLWKAAPDEKGKIEDVERRLYSP